MIVLGARPQFIKSAPIVHELLRRKNQSIDLQLIHSGQHYDYELSKIFFKELNLPTPLLDLGIGSGSHATQTGKAMIRLERCMIKAKPDIVLVPGDTNTTLAAALAAAKLNIQLGHIEAGARSYDMTMPEEVNRKITDHISNLLFTPTKTATQNLYKEGIQHEKVRSTGDTMVDALLNTIPTVSKMRDGQLSKFDISKEEYVLVTVHRPNNVDNPERLKSIVTALIEITKEIKVIFPAHPRTLMGLKAYKLMNILKRCDSLILTQPLGYLEMIAFLDASAAILTDSGGMQKEAFLLGVPCVTMRSVTEWPETLIKGANVLVDAKKTKIKEAIFKGLDGGKPRIKRIRLTNPFGDGKSSTRIVNAVMDTIK